MVLRFDGGIFFFVVGWWGVVLIIIRYKMVVKVSNEIVKIELYVLE